MPPFVRRFKSLSRAVACELQREVAVLSQRCKAADTWCRRPYYPLSCYQLLVIHCQRV
jgi:hypothetical protein